MTDDAEKIKELLQSMLDRFKRKQNLHQRAFRKFKDGNFWGFIAPLLVIQMLNTILPQVAQGTSKEYANGLFNQVIGVLVSSLAAVSAVWVGLQAKLRWAELSGGHKNAASIYQHLIVLAILEIQKAQLMKDYDKEKFFTFHALAQDLEAKAKADEYLIPLKVIKEKELEDKKVKKKELEESLKVSHEEKGKMAVTVRQTDSNFMKDVYTNGAFVNSEENTSLSV